MEDLESLESRIENAKNATITTAEPSIERDARLDDLPSIDELRRSEQEVTVKREIKGLTAAEPSVLPEDKPFKRKEDERKSLLKRRLKLVTAIYIAVVTLLVGFVGFNVATLAILSKDINSNTATIQAESAKVDLYEDNVTDPDAPVGAIEISLNEPRDYGDDKKELTFLDKITILFRNLFG